jgi:hypothetical protein
MQRHRHSEFIRFLNAVERAVPADKPIHAGQPLASPRYWLGLAAIHAGPSTSPRPRPLGSMRSKTSSPKITRQRIRHGVFHSIVPAGRHQRLPGRAQRQHQILPLDQIRRGHPRQTRPRTCTICLNQCTKGAAQSARWSSRAIEPAERIASPDVSATATAAIDTAQDGRLSMRLVPRRADRDEASQCLTNSGRARPCAGCGPQDDFRASTRAGRLIGRM